VILKDKLLAYIKTRKTPVTARMVAMRFGCVYPTAAQVMRKLIEEGAAKEVLVAEGNKYVRGIKI
jgi:hypothetical protein